MYSVEFIGIIVSGGPIFSDTLGILSAILGTVIITGKIKIFNKNEDKNVSGKYDIKENIENTENDILEDSALEIEAFLRSDGSFEIISEVEH